jgi:site-specific DNA recombinase
MKTAFQYIRKSNEDQSNFSISGQQTIIEEWAKRRDIKIIRTFIDDGYSAKDFNRPQWKELESVIRKSKVDYLLVMKYDRLIRNVIEGLSFVEKLEQKWKITLISVLENYSIDIHDPYFFKHRADMFVDADFERRRISDRTKFGIWSGRLQGRFLGKAPYGYINENDGAPKPKPLLALDPEAKKNVETIFTDFLNDVPNVVILSKVRKNGFPITGKEAIRRIVSNPVYAGLISVGAYKDNEKTLVKGMHEPIISEHVYWAAYYKLQEQIKPVTLKLLDENLPLRGFLQCQSCGSAHTGAKCKGKAQYYYYYWCNKCRGKNFSAKKVNSDIELILKGLSLEGRYLHALQVEAERKLEQSTADRKIQLQRVTREHMEIKTKMNNVAEKYFDGKITDETYQEWHSKYNKEMVEKQMDMDFYRIGDEEILSVYKESLPYLADLNYVYQTTPLENKQSLLKDIFPGCLTTLNEGYRTPFLPDIFSVNIPSIKSLVQVQKEREPFFSERFPVGVANGARTHDPRYHKPIF